MTTTSLFCLLCQLFIYLFFIGTTMEQPQFCSKLFQWNTVHHWRKQTGYKSNCCKKFNYIIWLPGWRVNYCGIARSILLVSSSKNEGGHVRLYQNSVTFTLATRVATVKHMLATMVAPGSFFSCFSTSLSLSDNIFTRLCCQALLRTCKPGKSNMFSAKVEKKHKKEVTA